MSIEVRVNTSVSSLWTCIKVLTEHIVCTKTERHYLNLSFCCLAHSLSHTHPLFVSPLFSLCFCFYRVEPVVIFYNFRILTFTWYQSTRVLRTSSVANKSFRHRQTNEKREMDRGMGSSLPTEKLDRSNYTSWSYKMHLYLLRHWFWSYGEGANKVQPESTHKFFPTWEQAPSRVLYCFASCVHDQMLRYIRDAKLLKDA